MRETVVDTCADACSEAAAHHRRRQQSHGPNSSTQHQHDMRSCVRSPSATLLHALHPTPRHTPTFRTRTPDLPRTRLHPNPDLPRQPGTHVCPHARHRRPAAAVHRSSQLRTRRMGARQEPVAQTLNALHPRAPRGPWRAASRARTAVASSPAASGTGGPTHL